MSGGSIRVLWDAADPCDVTITGGISGWTVNGSAVTFPHRVTSSTTFSTPHTGRYTISVKHRGMEIAGTPDGVREVELTHGEEFIFSPSPDDTRGVASGIDGIVANRIDDATSLTSASLGSLLQASVPGRVAQGENRTGTVTSASIHPANPVTVPLCVIEVQPSGELRVELEAQVCWRIDTAGAGTLDMLLYDITGGTATMICEDKLPVSADIGTTGIFPNQRVTQDIGPVTSARQYALYLRIRRASGSSLAASALNAAGVGTESLNRHSTLSARTV